MPGLESTLEDIVKKLRNSEFPNEQSISQGVVLSILSGLDWDVFDTAMVLPEYQTGEGRVDFALCHPPQSPRAFIEVKQPGGAEKGVRQALEYAFHTGVQFIALTDGQTWSFYLPAEPGSYEERRVFKLDLFEHSTACSAEILRRYLQQEDVASGDALETARKEYRSKKRRTVARQAISRAWRELVEKKDELLIELVGETVESKVGIRPEEHDVVNFLATLDPSEQASRELPPPSARARVNETRVTPTKKPRRRSSKRHASGILTIRGEQHQYATAKEALVIVLRELSRTDPTFLSRCFDHPSFQGRKRHYVARSLEDLYPGRPTLQEKCHERLSDGWFVGTNLNNGKKMVIIRGATEVAGLTFGRDVVVRFTD